MKKKTASLSELYATKQHVVAVVAVNLAQEDVRVHIGPQLLPLLPGATNDPTRCLAAA